MINGTSLSRQDFVNSMSQAQGVASKSNQSLADIINSTPVQATRQSMSDASVDSLLVSQINSEFTITKGNAVSSYEYSAQELAIRTISSRQNEGLALNENSEQLLARLDQSAAGIRNAYSNTSDILADIGQLGPKQRSFLASSEQRVERTMGSYQESIFRNYNEDEDKNRFSLSIKTQEGDTITIRFSSAQGNDEEAMQTVDTFQVEYEVDGVLSDDEHAALSKILSGVGELADDFFANGKSRSEYAYFYEPRQKDNDLNIDFLNDFDNQILSGFDLSFSTSGGGGDQLTRHNLDLSYQFDQVAMSQQFALDYESGLKQTSFDVDMSVFGQQDDQQLKNYLSVMEQSFQANNKIEHGGKKHPNQIATEKRNQQQASADFSMFKSAFTNMSAQANRYTKIETLAAQEFDNGRELVADLTKQMITTDPRYAESLKNNQLGAVISGLADFSAEFKFKIGFIKTENNISMQQKTDTTQSTNYQGVSQHKEVQGHSTKRPAHSTDTFTQKNKQSYTLNAAIEGQSIVALDQQHNKSSENKKFEYIFDEDRNDFIKTLTKHTIEQSNDESNIRLVEGLWLENSSKKTYNSDTQISLNGYRPTGVKQQNYSHQQLVRLIGDITPLIDNEKAVEKLNKKFNSIDSFINRMNDKL